MPLTGGQDFAGYLIVRLLGSGGMGEVYLAEHPRLPRHDALKVLSADVSADPDYRVRFEREADLASKLWHPHIVTVHDRGEHEGQLWISMDYVDGLDAARLLASQYSNGMPPDQAVRVVTAVASALDHAHKRGLLHRDVKPANIMITHAEDADDEQRILLADFGIARNVDDISGLTSTNMTVGTVAYCAPEQLLGEEIDGRADQYALAATAYHLLAGAQLFPHSNPAVVISRHLSSQPPALGTLRSELAPMDQALSRALSKDPSDRFARCAEFARAMADPSSATTFASPIPTTKPAPIPQAPASGTPAGHHSENKTPLVDTPRAASSGQRNLWLALSVATLLLVALLGGAGIYYLGAHESNDARKTSTTSSTPTEITTHPTSTTTSTPNTTTTTATTTRSPATDLSGLTPLVGRWEGHSWTLVIRQNGSGHFTYADHWACPACSTADAPTGTVDFTLTSVSNQVASGGVDVSSDEQVVTIGSDVTAQLIAGSPSGQIVQISLGRMQLPCCNKTSVGQCGA